MLVFLCLKPGGTGGGGGNLLKHQPTASHFSTPTHQSHLTPQIDVFKMICICTNLYKLSLEILGINPTSIERVSLRRIQLTSGGKVKSQVAGTHRNLALN